MFLKKKNDGHLVEVLSLKICSIRSIKKLSVVFTTAKNCRMRKNSAKIICSFNRVKSCPPAG